VDTFFENARRIFDVARSDIGAEASDFALLVRPDGSLHVVMETEMTLDAVAAHEGAAAAYRVSRSRNGVRVLGRNSDSRCEFSCPGAARAALVRDQPLYVTAPPIAVAVAPALSR
jgi:hypothetical protein